MWKYLISSWTQNRIFNCWSMRNIGFVNLKMNLLWRILYPHHLVKVIFSVFCVVSFRCLETMRLDKITNLNIESSTLFSSIILKPLSEMTMTVKENNPMQPMWLGYRVWKFIKKLILKKLLSLRCPSPARGDNMLPDASSHRVDQPCQLLPPTRVNIQAGVVE